MWRNVARLGGGTALGQSLVIASTPLVTRLYTPQAFGQFGLFLAFSSVVTVAIALRYDLAIASAVDEAEADELLAVALLVSLPTSAAAALTLWLMIRGDVLGFGALPLGAAPLLGALLFATGAVMSLRYWNVRGFRFRDVGVALALQGVGRALLPILVAVLSPGWWGLLAGEAAGRILGVVRMARGAMARLATLTTDRIARTVSRHWRYPTMVLPSSLLDAVAVAIPLPIISEFFGVAAAGQFALVQRVAAVPAALVASSFADVIHAEGSRLRDSPSPAIRLLAIQSVRRLGVIGAVIYVPVMLLAPAVFPLLFGADWREAGVVAAILAPYLWLTIVVSPLSRLILVNGRIELKVFADLVCMGLPVAALIAGRTSGFAGAMAAFSAASVLAYLFYLAIIWYAVGRPHPRQAG